MVTQLQESLFVTDKTRPKAVLTGATGGVGGAMAPLLAQRGWDLVLPARGVERLSGVIRKVKDVAPAAQVTPIDTDLSDHAQIRFLAEEILSAHPVIGALFNVAGYLSTELFRSPQDLDLHLELNTLSPLLLTHFLAPGLEAGAEERGTAIVTNTSSNAVGMSGGLNVDLLSANPKQGIFGAYGQTKLALTIATANLAPVYAPANIHLYAIDPGANQSAMTKGSSAPFFVRWMSSLLPKPQSGAKKLMAPLASGFGPESGAFIMGGKAMPMPKQAGNTQNIAKVMAFLDAKAGVTLTQPPLHSSN